MRYCRPFGLKGVSCVKCQGSAKPDDRWLREAQQRAGSMPARSVRMIYPEPETSVSTSGAWSGLSSNDGGGSNLQPARSDSPDLIDGGHGSGGYSPKGHFRQAEMPRFTGIWGPDEAPPRRSTIGPSPPGADGLDDGDGGADAAFDVEIGIIQGVGVGGRLQRRGSAIPVALVAFEDIG
jgi:hypothetical protein